MRVMLDTNIIISAGVFGGRRLAALTLLIADKFNLVISSAIIEEIRIVTVCEKHMDKVCDIMYNRVHRKGLLV